MRILQRYVLREVLVPTTLALVTLTFVLLLQMLFRRTDELTGILSLSLLFRLMGYGLPSLLILTIPMAFLTGVLLGVGRLTVDSEIKAFRTHGINLFPIFVPVLILGAAATVFSYFNARSIAPQLARKSFSKLEGLKEELIYSLEPGRFYDNFRSKGLDTVLYFDAKDPETGELRNGYISVEGSPKELQGLMKEPMDSTKYFFLAESGRIVATRPTGPPVPGQSEEEEPLADPARDSSAKMILTRGTIHFLGGPEDSPYNLVEFERMSVGLDTKTEMLSLRTQALIMTFHEFGERIGELEAEHRLKRDQTQGGKDGLPPYSEKAQYLRAEMLQRISISLACFSFVLIDLPLSIYIRPSGKSVGITIAFMLIMVYYGIMHYGVVLTRQGSGIGPDIGPAVIFSPNVILILLGSLLLYRAVHR